jgi:hypothetical protein
MKRTMSWIVSPDSTCPPRRIDENVDRAVGVAVGEQQQPSADVARQAVVDVAENQHLAVAEQLGFDATDEIAGGFGRLFGNIVGHRDSWRGVVGTRPI